MIIAIIGLTGSGKSTCAVSIAKMLDMSVFDMDKELPEEYKKIYREGGVVSVERAKEYQLPMIERLLMLAERGNVVLAGFFLDGEIPELLNRKEKVVWINLVTDNKNLLVDRVQKRKNHFIASSRVIEENWPSRYKYIVGNNLVNCENEPSEVVEQCLKIISLHE